jgi:hypothetical protein
MLNYHEIDTCGCTWGLNEPIRRHSRPLTHRTCRPSSLHLASSLIDNLVVGFSSTRPEVTFYAPVRQNTLAHWGHLRYMIFLAHAAIQRQADKSVVID